MKGVILLRTKTLKEYYKNRLKVKLPCLLPYLM